jgi:hypothetical protein
MQDYRSPAFYKKTLAARSLAWQIFITKQIARILPLINGIVSDIGVAWQEIN